MMFGIVAAMDEELSLIKSRTNIFKEEKVAGYTFYIGKLTYRDVILACCSIGKVNATVCSQILISKFKVGIIINIGTAGSMSDAKVGDIVIGSEFTYHDLDPYILATFPPKETYFFADLRFVYRCVKTCANNNIPYKLGRVVTGDCFISNEEQKNAIIERFHPISVDMESCAIAQVCRMNRVSFMMVRCISDMSDNKIENEFQTNLVKTSDAAGNILLLMQEDESRKEDFKFEGFKLYEE